MISLKNLIQLSVLLLLSAPFFSMPTHGQTVSPSVVTPPCGNIGNECPLSISPSVVQGIVGSTVTVNVVVNDTIGLGTFIVDVEWDIGTLQAVRVHMLNSSNVWNPKPPSQPTPPAWTSGGCYTGNSYANNGTLLQASMPTACIPFDFFNPNTSSSTEFPGCTVAGSKFTGCVVAAQVLLGGVTDCVSTAGCTLFSIDFQILPGITSLTTCGCATIDLNRHHLAPTHLLGVFHGGPFDNSCAPAPQFCKDNFPRTSNGQVLAVGSAALIKSKVDVAIHHLKLSSGNVQTLSAIVSNTGTIPLYVKVNFVIVSEAGDVSLVSTGVLLMPVGTNGILSASYTVPSLPLRYHVIGMLTIGANGTNFVTSGDTATTAYSVVL
jgi:hypothetical protein